MALGARGAIGPGTTGGDDGGQVQAEQGETGARGTVKNGQVSQGDTVWPEPLEGASLDICEGEGGECLVESILKGGQRRLGHGVNLSVANVWTTTGWESEIQGRATTSGYRTISSKRAVFAMFSIA